MKNFDELTGFHLNGTCPGPRYMALKKLRKILITQNIKMNECTMATVSVGGHHIIKVSVDAQNKNVMIVNAAIGPQ